MPAPRDGSRNAVLSAVVERAGLPVRELVDALPLGVDAIVTTRDGGVSSPPFASLNLGDHVGDDPACVAENRLRVARAIGVDPARLVTASQIHGAVVVPADVPAPRHADAITATRTDTAVAVLVADCVPLLLICPARHALAVVHAGWRGLVAGVIPAAVGMVGGETERVIAIVGPHISPASYQVGPDVARFFTDVTGALRDDVDDRSLLDLGLVVAHQLRATGVADDDRHACGECTDGGTTFFSDRAAHPCGRFGLVARWRS